MTQSTARSRTRRSLLSIAGVIALVLSAAGSAESEEAKAARLKAEAEQLAAQQAAEAEKAAAERVIAQREKEVAEDFQRFTVEHAPELLRTIDGIDKLIAERLEKLERIETVLKSQGRDASKDKDIIRWRRQIADAQKQRDGLDKRVKDLFVQYQKIVYAPDGAAAEKANRDAKVANEAAKATGAALQKVFKSSQ